MAWIVKPSATMTIERRPEAYLTSAMKKRHEQETLPRYETRMGALLPVLHDIQHAYGHVPYQAMIEVAEFLGLVPADVLDTLSFYEEFTTVPQGRCVIGVCQSIACEVCGHQAIVDHLRRTLGIEPGETTNDGRITLRVMECLGACDFAPVALVNEELHVGLTIEKVDEVVESARRDEPKSRKHQGKG
jgi:NADH:ubiquinone oxidoreductase subunit E